MKPSIQNPGKLLKPFPELSVVRREKEEKMNSIRSIRIMRGLLASTSGILLYVGSLALSLYLIQRIFS
jgi:hypothetical protein